jgi:hypothetical protein
MPKEVINFARDERGSRGKGVESSIHWGGPTGADYVQLGFEFDVEQMTGYLAGIATGGAPQRRGIFYTDPLERSEVQKLIRVTKRARDAVFGADE